ncbi:MAG: signal peptidase I [Anaerolineales bacterium]|nr:signal peptidase I [Anaerolineales bacterium]
MKNNRTQPFIPVALSSILFLLILWITLAPTQLGGWVTYAIVDGNSMEPGFYRGDLVLVRTAPVYSAGDAVVYKNAEMDSFVFHRIVRTELNRFVLQGDNNEWLDSYQPIQDEIIGKLWLHAPKLGKAIEWMRVPLHMSLIVAFLGAVFMFETVRTPSRRKKEKTIPSGGFGGIPEMAIYSFGFLVLVFLASGIYSFTRPLNIPAENIPYKQEGYYFYSATGTPGVYDTDVVRAGEPVFPKLTCFLNIGFNYNLSGSGLQGVSGTQKMIARIMDEQSGWVRTIPLNSETAFSGNSYFTTSTLDLCQVESLVNLVEEQAGLKQVSYTLEIVTDTAFTANMAGKQVSDSFAPALLFNYNKVNFYVVSGEGQADPLYSFKQGLAGGADFKPNTISLFGLKLSVWILRFVSLIGFGLSLYGLIMAGIGMYRTTSQSQEALIRLKYRTLLVDVNEQNIASTSSIIDVAAMEDLVRLAERYGTMILHMSRDLLHYYFVQSNGTTYRYVVTNGGNISSDEVIGPIIHNDVTNYTESINPVPVLVPAPEPIYAEEPSRAADKQENRVVYVYMPEPENTHLVEKHANETQVPKEQIEYVINTGELEFTTPHTETTVLRKIKL